MNWKMLGSTDEHRKMRSVLFYLKGISNEATVDRYVFRRSFPEGRIPCLIRPEKMLDWIKKRPMLFYYISFGAMNFWKYLGFYFWIGMKFGHVVINKILSKNAFSIAAFSKVGFFFVAPKAFQRGYLTVPL